MKKIRFNDLFLLPLACIPYAFLALYADFAWDTPLVYLCALLAPVALCWRWSRRRFLRLILLGNGISAVLSALLTFLVLRTANAYFTPLGALGCFAFLTLVSWMAQYLIWMRKKDQTPNQSLFLAVCLASLLLTAGVFCILVWKAHQIGAF